MEKSNSTESRGSFTEISHLAEKVASRVGTAITSIENVNRMVKLVSVNAQIEAARAGEQGKAFGVVAAEMNNLASQTESIVRKLDEETRQEISGISKGISTLASDVQGLRLSDLALTNIDLIDRNLYERSCDCRWWATDQSLVDALAFGTKEAQNHASDRMGVILKAYTVYFDLVLCDQSGTVVANGRPRDYRSVNTQHRTSEWFKSAMATRSGDEFGFQIVHRSPLANNQYVLVYSCTVREGGDSTGKVLGVLGVVFNWCSLAQTIVKNTPLSEEERKRTRVCITDGSGLVLADSSDQLLCSSLEMPQREKLFNERKGFLQVNLNGKSQFWAHALSPGFETYRTGWHSVIGQSTE